jgi:hypothetical protein
MAGRKRPSGSSAKRAAAAPIRDRPHLPPVYGVSKAKQGLLEWSHVEERMRKATRYWVSSVDSEGRPHATPVDGMRDLGAGGIFVFEPRLVFAWKDFTKDATRFRFFSSVR